MTKLRVWHIPQVPGKPFYVEVSTLVQAYLVSSTLAMYDQFQYENSIKGDYANAQGVSEWNSEEGEWLEWYSEEGDDFDSLSLSALTALDAKAALSKL